MTALEILVGENLALALALSLNRSFDQPYSLLKLRIRTADAVYAEEHKKVP